jgi:large subunit ribosomal protein L17
MRHKRKVKHFSRKSGPRKALLRGLVASLVEHGRISTTVDKAKELRRHVEKAITLGKKEGLATRRLLLSRFPNKETVSTIVDDLSKRFFDRPGGYTRIIKTGKRPGDSAEMAFIELVDYDYTKAKDAAVETKEAKTKDAKTADKAVKAKKVVSPLVAAKAKKKAVSKIQKKSRTASRA